MTSLDWQPSSDGYLEAASARPVPAPLTGSRYKIEELRGPKMLALVADPPPAEFELTLALERGQHDERDETLGTYETLDAAKAAADRHEQTGDVAGRDEQAMRRDMNLNARFLPQTGDEVTRPCIEVGGVQVYAYIDEATGQLRVSIDYDTAHPDLLIDDGELPTRIRVGGELTYEP
ncbi:hypothetical protein [Actinoplanes sp. URMC 104]|uniref:hypothetical protein n=1 Tax=Actinoplanes sp. URMC 104 TaxID=3423409 RepID=UPI003F1C3DB2